MFRKIDKTTIPPNGKPMMVWDGDCNFCRYWICVLKSKTGDELEYQTYQEAAGYYSNISRQAFAEAVRLIDGGGQVYSGPDSAYRAFFYFKNPIRFAHDWYDRSKVFRFVSDHAYHFVSTHRPLMLTLTRMMWGNDPLNRKPYWLIYLVIILIPVVLLFF
ncbi:hypothetical protein C900_04145 [Fulvivirga imtechensis AK7]|uniref:Thiol-disulfide oxidoreductase n=1 Tax=Fulvivirga imtechensis AK7 TaxID=1237149 RepID=L8JYQ5_9BACT|nr:DCC1-like thiol-disulfide oxidoreductase family protein [Fulvivirga imtechensis]ELR73293.1 hypothetical protein C900_04145 [Fulvivirga imtechensis AK7]